VADNVNIEAGPSTSKRARVHSTEEELRGGPSLSVSSQANATARQTLVQTLLLAARTWDLLHSTEHTKRGIFFLLSLQKL
jgi:hypothetical protein